MKRSICLAWSALMIVLVAMLVGPACSTSVSMQRNFDYFEPSGTGADTTERFKDGGCYEIGFDVGQDRLRVAGAVGHGPGIVVRVELGRSRQLRFLSREFVFRQAALERKVAVGYWSYPTTSGLTEIRPWLGSVDFLGLLDGSVPKVPLFFPAKFEAHLIPPAGIDTRQPFTLEIPATSASGPLIVTFTPKVARYTESVPRGW